MILRGWKDICKAAGGISDKTARRLMREEGFPVAFVARVPQTTQALLEAWVEKHVKDKLQSLDGMGQDETENKGMR